MRQWDHVLAFSDGVEDQILHTGHQFAPVETKQVKNILCEICF